MELRVVGAGLGRTGTMALKQALDRLGAGPTYHMVEVFGRPDHAAEWHRALREGDVPDFDRLYADYGAAVDWPAARWWRPAVARYPDALVVLSRRDPEAWWQSMSSTIFPSMRAATPPDSPVAAMRAMAYDLLLDTFGSAWDDRDHVLGVLAAHEADVVASVPPERLLVFEAAQGWEPLCERLGVAVPDEPFPRVNSTAEFRMLAGLDRAP